MIILYHVVPSIIRTAVLLVLVYLVIKVFKVKNPSIKALLYLLPLIKGYIGLVLGTGYIHPHGNQSFFNIAFSIDKSTLLALFSKPKVDIFYWSAVIGIALAFIINIARWLGIVIFYRNLSYEAQVTRNEVPEVFAILDQLVPKFKIKYPQVIISHKKYATPVLLGFRKPKLIFSANLLQELTKQDLKLIIAHELAHLKRYDFVLHWAAFTLRDCQFFNPLAHIIFKKLDLEKEKAADMMAVDMLGLQTKDLAKTLSKVNNYLFYKKAIVLPLGSAGITGVMKDYCYKPVYMRIKFLLENKLFREICPSKKVAFTIFTFYVILYNFSFAIPFAQKILIIT